MIPEEIKITKIDGAEATLADYRGKVLLITNTASACGFTGQLHQLEELYQRYKDRGFCVLGFPANDFLNQEPLEGEMIEKHCSVNYGVTFPIFAKSHVRGRAKHDMFIYLTEKSEKKLRGELWWNFEKFLLDRDLVLRARFRSITRPNSSKIVKLIEELL
jgi:glutathione peroxidase